MSLITSPQTSQGFIAGADGRVMSPLGIKEGDRETKLFECRNRDNVFIYALTGQKSFPPTPKHYPVQKSYCFLEYCESIADSLNSKQFTNARHYVEEFAACLKRRIEKAREESLYSNFFRTDDYLRTSNGYFFICQLTFLGYFDGEPFARECKFWHRDQNIKELETAPLVITLHRPYWNYRTPLLDKLNEEPRLAQYRDCLQLPHADSLDAALAYTESYLRLCCDETIKDLDPNLAECGGEYHIAQLTPKGFEWKKKPWKLRSNDSR